MGVQPTPTTERDYRDPTTTEPVRQCRREQGRNVKRTLPEFALFVLALQYATVMHWYREMT